MAFEGEVDQVPPVYSAAKVTGRRAYDLARAGQEVSLEPRRVHIYSIGMLAYDFPRLTLAVCCGKGTYIRSLARDLGVRLGCGAVVETLRRDSVGPFTTADAVSLDATPLTARDKLRPVRDALSELRWLTLKAAEVARMRQGQTVPYPEPLAERDLECAVFDDAGALRAIARWDHNRGSLVPLKVLSTEY